MFLYSLSYMHLCRVAKTPKQSTQQLFPELSQSGATQNNLCVYLCFLCEILFLSG